jgi:hypothetical protein
VVACILPLMIHCSAVVVDRAAVMIPKRLLERDMTRSVLEASHRAEALVGFQVDRVVWEDAHPIRLAVLEAMILFDPLQGGHFWLGVRR